ncbi:hypothetical protein IL306_003965 [Fusarium sp. DS 682]|nr:hypothetical protein IL306_003965 [Fusarium sp. DS 682]
MGCCGLCPDKKPERLDSPRPIPVRDYTKDERARFKNVNRNYGWDKKGWSQDRQNQMADTFLHELKKAKENGRKEGWYKD